MRKIDVEIWREREKSFIFVGMIFYLCFSKNISLHPSFMSGVSAPKVMILDEEGHTVTERYYKAGSAVELSCVARQIETPSDSLMWWRGSKILTSGIRWA